MLNDKALLVNRFISVPRDLGDVNCGAHLGWQKKPMDSSTDPENQILYAQKYSFSFLLHIKFQFFGNTQ